jgi:hypothetical protein
MTTLGVVIVFGVLTVLGFALGTFNPGGAAGVGFLLAGACLLAGALFGFLFGSPRALQRGDAPSEQTGETREKRDVQYGANTNLEQISDWLTKILVGVGLTQVNNLWGGINATAGEFAAALGGGSVGKPLAIGILLYFPVAGFLFGYLWTRLFLAGALARADLAAQVAAVREELTAQQEQAQRDAEALSLVRQFLAREGNQEIPPEQLKKAIKSASKTIKSQVFYEAYKVRSENWRDQKAVMERTIPVFEALVEDDTEHRFHQNYAQLAYALKDKRSPELAKADELLTKAIEIRGPWKHAGWWVVYEFNRASCRIQNDPEFLAEKPSTEENRRRIVDDLRVTLPEHTEWFARPPVDRWMGLNGLTMESPELTI